jgi:hypothetical protein
MPTRDETVRARPAGAGNHCRIHGPVSDRLRLAAAKKQTDDTRCTKAIRSLATSLLGHSDLEWSFLPISVFSPMHQNSAKSGASHFPAPHSLMPDAAIAR